MFVVYMKDNSTIYKSGFASWQEANRWGRYMFGLGGFEIEREMRTIIKNFALTAKKTVYKIYRRFMRQLARFILGFDNCPVDYQCKYKTILSRAVQALALVAVFELIFIIVVLNFM